MPNPELPPVLSRETGLLGRLSYLVWRSETLSSCVTLVIFAALSSWSFAVDRDTCMYMGCLFLEELAPWWAWSAAWGVYALLKSWRIVSALELPKLAYAINSAGFFLFSSTAIAVTYARWPSMSLSAAPIALALAAFWVMVRTGIHSGRGWRGD